ncbi:unnamed protein product [Parajaminaea phylloscopi]
MRFAATVSAFFLAAAATMTVVEAGSNPDDPAGKVLYMAQPSCDYYKCKVYWAHGSSQTVMWWNAPAGDVKVELVPEKDGPTYTIQSKIGGTVNQKACHSQAPNGESCGTFKWTVPNDVKPGSYSVSATSLKNPSKSGWTDTVIVTAAKKSNGNGKGQGKNKSKSRSKSKAKTSGKQRLA